MDIYQLNAIFHFGIIPLGNQRMAHTEFSSQQIEAIMAMGIGVTRTCHICSKDTTGSSRTQPRISLNITSDLSREVGKRRKGETSHQQRTHLSSYCRTTFARNRTRPDSPVLIATTSIYPNLGNNQHNADKIVPCLFRAFMGGERRVPW